ncbi:MAG: DegV family EDD domain-containing protein [Ruminococcaceae bacterium]|nr:DegV family EDD domain-containing protein [Oscillospiraceae bacterium]
MNMKIKIVGDSASNLYSLTGVDYECAPLRIVTDNKEYVDTVQLNIQGMLDDLRTYKGKSGTACPGVGDYLAAFEGYDIIYVVTIISTLSGSYNAAMQAKAQYEEENPGKKVFVVDSYTAGGEQKLHLEKLRDLVLAGKDYETVCREITEYKDHGTSLVFSLESMINLANNGRVPMIVAKAAGLIGLRMIGIVSEEGQIHPTDKARGEKKAIETIWAKMLSEGYKGGRLRIDNCFNVATAEEIKKLALENFPGADVRIEPTGALCSFYAEKGGLMIGFEI